jgi:hypothetical protein
VSLRRSRMASYKHALALAAVVMEDETATGAQEMCSLETTHWRRLDGEVKAGRLVACSSTGDHELTRRYQRAMI